MAAMNEKDYYAILGVDSSATQQQIQKAFQQKARKLHPDISKEPDAEERFKEVSEAYAVLSDEEKRAHYDAVRTGNPFMNTGRPSAGYTSYPGGFDFDGFPFTGAWGQTTARRAATYHPQEGSDVVVDIDLSHEEAKSGARKAVHYRRYDTCPHCSGTGSTSDQGYCTCPTCGGRGNMTVDVSNLFAMGVINVTCPECGGSGRVVKDPCDVCGGSGRSAVATEQVVEFPANSHDGTTVRIKGRGNAGTNGASSGDFVARARVASERLEGRPAMGFTTLGFLLPFLLFAAMQEVFGVLFIMTAVPLFFSISMIMSEGIAHRSAIWWKRGFQRMLNGAINGLLNALIFVSLISCVQGLFLAPFALLS